MRIFKSAEIPFVIIIGKSDFKNPYRVQSNTPIVIIKNILGETSSTFLDLQALIIWGKAATVVKIPASVPMISSNSITIELFIDDFV